MKLITLTALIFCVVIVTLMTSASNNLASAASLTKRWSTTLPSSTVTGVNLPTWIQPQSASFTFLGLNLYAVTTADGALNMLQDGKLLWRKYGSNSSSSSDPVPTGYLQRSCGGNSYGLFISQNGMIIALDPQTGFPVWTRPISVYGFSNSSRLYLYNDIIIVNDDTSIAAVSAENGNSIWARMNQCSSPCQYHCDVVGQSGRVGFMTKNENGVVGITVVDKNGNTVQQKSFPGYNEPFFANVDSQSFTLVNLNNPIVVVRYPLLVIDDFSEKNQGESITGYSFTCPEVGGGVHCGPNGKNGYSTLFINTNYRTYSFNFSTGMRNAQSVLHPHIHFHLVSFAQVVTISESVSGSTRLFGFDWKTMQSKYNVTLPTVQPYNLRLNWYNQMVAECATGFYFFQAVSNELNSDFSNAYPGGLVTANTVIDDRTFTVTSGNTVASYSFVSKK